MCVSAASSCGNIALSSNVLPMMQNLKEGELCRIEIILCLHVICLKYMMQFKNRCRGLFSYYPKGIFLEQGNVNFDNHDC